MRLALPRSLVAALLASWTLLMASLASAMPVDLTKAPCTMARADAVRGTPRDRTCDPVAQYEAGDWRWYATSTPRSMHRLRVSVRQSRFDRVAVVFRYSDGREVRLQAGTGDYGSYWRLGGQLAFDAPERAVPVASVAVGFENAAWPHLLSASLEAPPQDTTASDARMIIVGASLALLALSAVGNILLGLATRRRGPFWHAGWAVAVLGWALMWTQAVLLFAPGLAGTTSSRLMTFFATAAISCAGSFLLTMTWSVIPRLLRVAVGAASIAVAIVGTAVALASGAILPVLANILEALIFLSGFLAISACGVGWHRRSRQARDVLLSFIVPLVAVLWSSSSDVGIVKTGQDGMLAVLLACALQTVWLTLVAGWRISKMRVERDAAVAGEAQMATLAHTDPLTGLLNRRGFVERAQHLLGRDHGIALILLDLDHFKKVNDQFGHDIGDQLLRAVGETLHHTVRDAVIGRLGGEEFGILASVSSEAARMLAARVLKSIASIRVPAGDTDVVPTASAGVAAGTSEPFNALYRLADRALYAAKARGRNCIVMGGSGDHRGSHHGGPDHQESAA